jgi:PhnB protein
MELSPYLWFSGNCEEAFKFYEKALNGKIEMMQTHGESPMADKVAPEWRTKIIHVRMIAGDNVLMGSDLPPEHYSAPKGFSVSLGIKEPAEAERIFNLLAAGGQVQMPIGATFWSVKFGMATDRFGIPWMVNCTQVAQ